MSEPNRENHHDVDDPRAEPHCEPSELLRPLDPMMPPVYAGDVGPGTWVVEVPAGKIPVTVPSDAVAVLAGHLSPHAYVTPVQTVRPSTDAPPDRTVPVTAEPAGTSVPALLLDLGRSARDEAFTLARSVAHWLVG